MSEFESAVEYVFQNEGGLSENPNDSGGMTNYGISLRFLRELSIESLRRYGIFEIPNEQSVRNLTIEQAKSIYFCEFWKMAPFEKINDQAVCNYIFDMAVSMGLNTAIKLVQQSLWAISHSRSMVKDDGILGDVTLGRINLMMQSVMLPPLIATRASYYRLIAEVKPKDREFLNGWLNRCYGI